MKKIYLAGAMGALALTTGGAAFAQEGVSAETAFVFNTLLFMIMGMVVMFMAAGFCMLEAGMVRSKNAATICLKNITLYSIATVMVWVVGYGIIYGDNPTGFFGWAGFFWGPDDSAALDTGYSSHSDWFFQMVFVATAASIVSGTVAERIRIMPFFLFTVALTGFIYPVQASWEWGGGFLDSNYAFSDFAGSTLVHATGGWAALAGAIALGPRRGKYGPNGEINKFAGSSLPLATLGVFILWLGWFGFNGGSQLALGSQGDAIAVSQIFVNTNMAAATGVITVVLLCILLKGKVDVGMALNGAIGGLVVITAEPLAPTIPMAALWGVIGGVAIFFVTPLLEAMRIDDVVGAIPAHLACGIIGTMVVPFSYLGVEDGPTFLGQAVGVGSNAIFVFGTSIVLWYLLRFTIGIRAGAKEEDEGLDASETGGSAYPDFVPKEVPALGE
ncbi:ammonium transporter [Parvularcula flava]|uniref:Ammonium transporter n=1 Tax=Aquisalinus luteolus TaxID=1566827 RepID=A0A8J3A321_9PROT|nr:ammonium transporter [Aquisalinus luteolus]NHK28725.1 ammonium transporter [Aquisalinus luteolus]GGH99329.1 ammonium transporter channel family protein [Aquisalinus luteolus]